MPHDLDWWAGLLDAENLSRPIPGPTPLKDMDTFSDTSSGFSVDITIGKSWQAWHLLPGGRQMVETLCGQKQSASSSSYSLSCHPVAVASTSKSMEITKVWLKAGGRVEAETGRLTSFSATSMPSWASSY